MSRGTLFSTTGPPKTEDAQPFESMKEKLDPVLLRAIKEVLSFEIMTPVQAAVLNQLPTLRADCLVQAKTGTGKTTAFLLPAIQSILNQPVPKGQVAVLILSPTRELALQIAAEAKLLVSSMLHRLEIHTAFGGTGRAANLNAFMSEDPKVLVATPGRLNDYLAEEGCRRKFTSMQTLILDEADRMLDAGFLPDILQILNALPPKKLARWQGMCFSATMPPSINQVLPIVLNPEHTRISTLDTSEPPTVARVPQYSVVISSVRDTFNALFTLLNAEVQTATEEPKIIVFGTTANLVALYAKVYEGLLDLRVFELHSRMTQSRRTRMTTDFKDANRGIMFASDVIGRGMDFPSVSHVIQVGLPADSDAYTHRVGRTARAGRDGRAIIILTEPESFFLTVNRQFPIKPYGASKDIFQDTVSRQKVATAMENIDLDTKRKAYSAYLGFMKGFSNKLKLNAAGLVSMANMLALEGMHCAEVPEMEKRIIGKMGLKGTPGIRYASVASSNDRLSRKKFQSLEDCLEERPKRRRHQDAPGPIIDDSEHSGKGSVKARGGGRRDMKAYR